MNAAKSHSVRLASRAGLVDRRDSAGARAGSAAGCREPAGSRGRAGARRQPAATPAPPKPMPAQLPDVLARVNGEDVKKADFERLVKNMEAGRGADSGRAARRDPARRARSADHLHAAEAGEPTARKSRSTDAEIDAQIAQMQTQFPTRPSSTRRSAPRNMTVEQLKADARVDMTINKLMDAEVATMPAPRPTPTRRTSTTRTPTSSSKRNRPRQPHPRQGRREGGRRRARRRRAPRSTAC